MYSDVVLNVPLVRPKRALITDLRTALPEDGAASPDTNEEGDEC